MQYAGGVNRQRSRRNGASGSSAQDEGPLPTLAVIEPSVDLRPLVRRYVAFTASTALPPLVLPAWNKQKLLFHFGDPMAAEFEGQRLQAARVTLSGAAHAPYRIHVSGTHTRFFAVELTPVGYLSWLRHHATAVVDRILSGYDALPARMRRSIPLDAVADADRNPTLQVARVEGWLRRHLPDARELYRLRHVGNAVRLIDARQGDVSMAELAGEVGVSGALLRRQFRWAAGIPPKQFAMRTRDGLAFNRMIDGGGRSSAKLAAELGYADQSHLIRSVNRYIGNRGGGTSLSEYQASRPFT